MCSSHHHLVVRDVVDLEVERDVVVEVEQPIARCMLR